MNVITLVIVGKHSQNTNTLMTEKQIETEKERPERITIDKFVYMNHYLDNSK